MEQKLDVWPSHLPGASLALLPSASRARFDQRIGSDAPDAQLENSFSEELQELVGEPRELCETHGHRPGGRREDLSSETKTPTAFEGGR